MTAYQFQFYAVDGRRPAFSFADCADDAQAVLAAMTELRSHATCDGVEVWREDELIAALEGGLADPIVRRPRAYVENRQTAASRRPKFFQGPGEPCPTASD